MKRISEQIRDVREFGAGRNEIVAGEVGGMSSNVACAFST